MNKSKKAIEQKSIAELFERLQYAINIFDFEMGESKLTPKFIRHEGNLWSIKMFNKRFLFHVEVED